MDISPWLLLRDDRDEEEDWDERLVDGSDEEESLGEGWRGWRSWEGSGFFCEPFTLAGAIAEPVTSPFNSVLPFGIRPKREPATKVTPKTKHE